MGRRNNQPNDSVGGGMGIGEAMQTGVCSSLWVANEATKKIKIEMAIGPRIRWLFLDGRTQQPTEKQPYHWYVIWRDGAQGNDDRGGRYRVFLAIGFHGKKINTTKFVVALGGRQSTTARNNQPNLHWIDGGVIGEDV